MGYFSIGVDLGGTNLRIAAVDGDGRFLELVNTPTECSRGRELVLDEMCAAITVLSQRFQQEHALVGIGIGVPGIIDMATGMLRESPNLPGWHDYPVREEIERRLRARVVLENDANCAAFGEYWLGAGRGFSDLCMLTLGTGVGGGIVLGGRLHHGMTGMAGELGHITVVPEGAPCGCGNRGCLEQYASASAVSRMAAEAVAAGNAPRLQQAMAGRPAPSSEEVFRLAMEGDAAARRVFQTVGESLGTVIASLINALNLPIYVIGGGVSSGWEAFASVLLDTVRRRSFVFAATTPLGAEPHPGRSTIIARAQLGGDAGLLGAARLPMQTASSQ